MPRDDFEIDTGRAAGATLRGLRSAEGAPEGDTAGRSGTAADVQFARNYDRMSAAILKAQSAFNSFADFLRKHRPGRSAHYPDSHIMTVSLLAGLVLIEGLINAYFFSKSSDLGLLGGWIQAITVAFTNVIAAFFLVGFGCLRLLQNPFTRPISWGAAAVALAISLAALALLNLTAAHYRDLLEINAATLAEGGAAETGLLILPVPSAMTLTMPQTLEGLLLLILGVTFAAIAAFKGATFDDPLVGYGAVDRRLHKAKNHLSYVYNQSLKRGDADPDQVARAKALLDEIDDFLDGMKALSAGAAMETLEADTNGRRD